jgi:hypothetical protein
MTKTGSRNSPGQRHTARREFDAIAGELGQTSSSFPRRLTKKALPLAAATGFGARLAEDLVATAAPLVITLRDEVWAALASMAEIRIDAPADGIGGLNGPAYGGTGKLRIGAYEADWLPLVHPGLLRATADEEVLTLQEPGVSERSLAGTKSTTAGPSEFAHATEHHGE